MKPFFITLFTGIVFWCNSQAAYEEQEKIKIKDTINVTNYFIVKPYLFYNLYLRRVVCEGNYYLNNSLTKTFVNKYSYGIGTQLIRKVKKIQYGLSLKYIFSQENYGARILFDDGTDSIYTSHSQLAQLEIGLLLGREYKFNTIKIIPSIGLNYNRNLASNSRFIIQDSQNLPNYTSVDIDNLYSKHMLTANIGCDVTFFCHRRISPFLGYQYMKAFTREAQQSIYDIKIVRHGNLFLLGLVCKL